MQSQNDPSFDLNYARCVEQLNGALHELGGTIDPGRVARTAELIMQTMTGAWRFFHTPEHIFDVGRSGDAVEVLAALFHDAIHIQADNGVSVNVGQIVAPFVRESGKSLRILPRHALPADPLFEVVCRLFAFEPGQALQPHSGQNEFLSAVVAAKSMEGMLPLGPIAEMCACIEATIPFRFRPGDAASPCRVLRGRLETANQEFGLGWDIGHLDMAVRRAVRLANRDVENFAHVSSAEFLNNTWNLMPETNHDLRGAYSYTVSGYRKSLQKMEGFMRGLSAESVFQQYQDEPRQRAYAAMLERTRHNLEVARLYLGCKMLSIAIVEAISLRVGTEVPLATMMGELPQRGSPDAQMESFLPPTPTPMAPRSPLQQEVLDLLEKGRSEHSNYDVKHSPVATYVVKALGFERAGELLQIARQFFDGTMGGESFLSRCEPAIVDAIVTAVYHVFDHRIRALKRGQNYA